MPRPVIALDDRGQLAVAAAVHETVNAVRRRPTRWTVLRITPTYLARRRGTQDRPVYRRTADADCAGAFLASVQRSATGPEVYELPFVVADRPGRVRLVEQDDGRWQVNSLGAADNDPPPAAMDLEAGTWRGAVRWQFWASPAEPEDDPDLEYLFAAEFRRAPAESSEVVVQTGRRCVRGTWTVPYIYGSDYNPVEETQADAILELVTTSISDPGGLLGGWNAGDAICYPLQVNMPADGGDVCYSLGATRLRAERRGPSWSVRGFQNEATPPSTAGPIEVEGDALGFTGGSLRIIYSDGLPPEDPAHVADASVAFAVSLKVLHASDTDYRAAVRGSGMDTYDLIGCTIEGDFLHWFQADDPPTKTLGTTDPVGNPEHAGVYTADWLPNGSFPPGTRVDVELTYPWGVVLVPHPLGRFEIVASADDIYGEGTLGAAVIRWAWGPWAGKGRVRVAVRRPDANFGGSAQPLQFILHATGPNPLARRVAFLQTPDEPPAPGDDQPSTYTFRHVAPGPYRLEIRDPNGLDWTWAGGLDAAHAAELDVARGELATAPAVTLARRTIRVDGMVWDAVTDRPAAGATVDALDPHAAHGSEVLVTATTDDTGSFVLAAVPNGPARLRITLPGHADKTVQLAPRPASVTAHHLGRLSLVPPT